MSKQNRRSFLRSGVGVASVLAAGGLAGCTTQEVPFVGGSSVIDSVPTGSDSVMFADIEAILADDGVRTLTNTYLDQQSQYEYYEGPETIEEWISEVENEWEIETDTVNRATVFGQFGGEDYETYDSEYGAALLRIEVTIENIRDSLEEGFGQEFQEEEYNGQIVYTAEEGALWIGALPSEGSVVVGTEDGVQDTIDVSQGDASAVDGELSNAFSDTRDSPFRFASRVPDPGPSTPISEEVTRYGGNEEETYDLTVFSDVTVASGSIYRDGSVRGMEVSLVGDGSETASELAELLREMQDDWVSMWENDERETAAEVAAVLDEVSIS